MKPDQTKAFVEPFWEEAILPTLEKYIRIPNESPQFDRDWRAHGYMESAVQLAEDWVRRQEIAGASVEVWRLGERTPTLFIEVPGTPGLEGVTALLYGHLDKQPPMLPWAEGLGPWEPVVRDGKLYGRGGADDGYAVFASVAAIKALQAQGAAHPRLVCVIECSEESGSPDLPAYIETYADRIGSPGLVVCLDSGCGDYERLWMTTSLRGLTSGNLRVDILEEGLHSGSASGVVASSFRIARQLLSRIEDPASGRLLLDALHVDIPEDRRTQAGLAADVLGAGLDAAIPFVRGARAMVADPVELLLNRTWRPTLSVTGAEGLPALGNAGNVLRPFTTLRLSFRLPPTLASGPAAALIKETFEVDPPYGAKVTFELDGHDAGWAAPPLEPWLEASLDAASEAFFGPKACYLGEGGSIPFMAMLGDSFPAAQFVITGVLGPKSNAHGPNEFLHIATGKRVTSSVAHILADYGRELAG